MSASGEDIAAAGLLYAAVIAGAGILWELLATAWRGARRRRRQEPPAW